MTINAKRLCKKMARAEVHIYFLGIIVSLAYCWALFNLWDYDFSIPIWYADGDNLSSLLITKKLSDGFFVNSYLGAPFNALGIDFPFFGDVVNLFVLKVFMSLFHNACLSNNLFYVLTFPATFCISFAVMRKYGVSKEFAFVGAMSFAFLPYRLLRGTAHLYLSNYTFIPLTFMICATIYQSDDNYSVKSVETQQRIKYIIIAVLMALCGIYYAFFTCFFMVAIIIIKALNKNKVSRFGIEMLIVVVLVVSIAYIPYAYLKYIYGVNVEAPNRSPIEAEVYGLKIAQFFLPNLTHGIGLLEKLQNVYRYAPVPNEGSEYLGITGGIGLIISLIFLFINNAKKDIIKLAAYLNISAILLSTIGGFGSLFALFISPQIRGYNRISVFVAFFSIYTTCFLATQLKGKLKRVKKVFVLIVVVLITAGIIEQSFSLNARLDAYAEDYISDKAFVGRIEKELSLNAMVYQLPYVKYPEEPPINRMGDYAMARAYLHSTKLRWSYGDNKGRNADMFLRELSKEPIEEQIKKVAIIGFEGIYIDTFAYMEEEMIDLEKTLDMTVGTNKFRSQNGRLLFYNLFDYKNELTQKYSVSQIKLLKEKCLVTPHIGKGFYGSEGDENQYWNWCQKTGTLKIINYNQENKEITVVAKVFYGSTDESVLTITYQNQTLSLPYNQNGAQLNLHIIAEPGTTDINFETNAERVYAPSDPRELYMRFENLETLVK